MAITKCGYGHIYDSDIYASCPYCNNGTNEINFDPGATEAISVTEAGVNFSGTTGPLGVASADMQNNNVSRSNINPTVPADDENIYHGSYDNPFRKTERAEGEKQILKGGPSMPIGKTVIADMNFEGIVPVVGWIVCIEGKMRGKSYNLYSKQNTVGRGVKSDAFIEGDNTISNHQANISYDKRHNAFTLVPKTETNTMYLNDEAVYESVRLKAFDLIEMGSSKFIFVPFCGDRFKWEP